MCGIAFFINYGKQQLNPEYVYELFEQLNLRGTDASGYYFERLENGKMVNRMVKAPVDSESLIYNCKQWENGDSLYPYKIDGTERLIMLHCRAKTRGSQFNNRNNMPIESKRYVLIHNGVVNNAKMEKYDYQAEVDSEEILARIERLGIVNGLRAISGSMAVVIKPIYSQYIILYRNTNPLDLVLLPDTNILVGCSNESYVNGTDNGEDLNSKVFKDSRRLTSLPKHQVLQISLTKQYIKKLAAFPEEIGTVTYRK